MSLGGHCCRQEYNNGTFALVPVEYFDARSLLVKIEILDIIDAGGNNILLQLRHTS